MNVVRKVLLGAALLSFPAGPLPADVRALVLGVDTNCPYGGLAE